MIIDLPLVVLAGGYGTRIRPSIGDTAKILAPVNDKTLLHYQMENWISLGIRKFLFILHFKADDVKREVAIFIENSINDIKVDFHTEVSALGTGGGINEVVQKGKLTGEFLVINGDTWLSGGFDEISTQTAHSLLLKGVNDVSRFGAVELDEMLSIKSFLEKTPGKPNPGLIYAGLCKLSHHLFNFEFDKLVSLENDLFPRMVHEKILKGVVYFGDFIDIGVPKDYQMYVDRKLSKEF